MKRWLRNILWFLLSQNFCKLKGVKCYWKEQFEKMRSLKVRNEIGKDKLPFWHFQAVRFNADLWTVHFYTSISLDLKDPPLSLSPDYLDDRPVWLKTVHFPRKILFVITLWYIPHYFWFSSSVTLSNFCNIHFKSQLPPELSNCSETYAWFFLTQMETFPFQTFHLLVFSTSLFNYM